MGFKKSETHLEGLVIIDPDVFADERGFFKETYNQNHFKDIGLDLKFVQDNVSYSQKGTLRGLHFQAPPHEQGKLVSVLKGTAIDVAVDIRKSSPTYGQHIAVEISGENHRMVYVPPGFAHGFSVLSLDCLFCYKCTGMYNKQAEGGILWNDPDLNIDWQVETPIISGKDQQNTLFKDFETPFK